MIAGRELDAQIAEHVTRAVWTLASDVDRHVCCERCTMCAASPMVVPNGRVRAGGEVLGVCANKPACERRVNIAAATKAKKP